MEKQYTQKFLLFIFIIVITIISGGIALGIYYSSLPEHHPQDNKPSCESVGGQWSDEQSICLLSYKEAGELCTDGGQCISGICFPQELSEEQKIAVMNKPIKDITGTCYSDDEPVGCVEQVLMGTVSKESMCLDD